MHESNIMRLFRVYMEAVKLESMHAPEHAMSSLVVAQVFVILLLKVKVTKVVIKVVIEVVAQVLVILLIQGSTEATHQVAQEAQNVREAESTVLTTTTTG